MSNATKYEEEELIALLKAESKEGFDYLYENYSRALYGVIHNIIPDEEKAQDILQDVFVKIWNNIQQYDSSKGRFYTWIFNIARNASIDKTRSKEFNKERKTNSIDNSVFAVNRSNWDTMQVDHIGLDKIIQTLTPDQQNLLDLIYFKGYTQAEVSEMLAMPLGTVKTKIRKIVLTLREKLEV